MDTLFVIRDSVVACVRNSSDLCQPCVKSGLTGISWQEVVCLAIILFFAIIVLWILCKYQIFSGKKGENNGNEENKDAKKNEEQLAKLKDRLYSQLQSRVYIEKFDASGRKIKEYNEKNDEVYINRLESDIKELAPNFIITDFTKPESKSPNNVNQDEISTT